MENNRNILHVAPERNDRQCTFDVLENCKEKNPSELLRDEFVRFMEADLIIIRLDYMRPGDYKKGIELLKLIRLHHINTYCVAYSNRSLRYHVDEDANKSILLSKGVTHVQMPGGIIDESHPEFAKWLTEKSPENLEDYFLHDYKQFFSGNRHFHANWWAPLRIMEYLKRADHLKDEDMIYSNDEARTDKESFFGQVLRYIKTLKEHSVWDRKVEAFIAENKSLTEANRLLEETKAPIEEVIEKTIADGKLKEAVLSSATAPINAEIHENKEVIESRQQEISDYHQAKEARHLENASTPNVERLRDVLAKQKPKILFLDDMAGYGWDYVLQQLIYKEDHVPEFNIWSYFPDDVAVTEVAQMILHKTKESGADLVIMDLRLKNEKGEMKPQDLSGIKLLEALRKERVGCPILVITASKNPETIDQVYASGADACWRKEGIDENNSEDPAERVAYTWGKIEQLLTIINTLCGEEFKYHYRELLPCYDKIASEKMDFWWQKTMDCMPAGSRAQSIPKEKFLEMLQRAIDAFQHNLVDMVKGRTSDMYDAPTSFLFEIMDLIHPTVDNEIQSGNVGKIQRDWKFKGKGPAFYQRGCKACKKRNIIIHHEPSDSSSLEVFRQMNEFLMDYFTPTVNMFDVEEMVEEPAKAAEEPVQAVEEPVRAAEEPAQMVEEPAGTTEGSNEEVSEPDGEEPEPGGGASESESTMELSEEKPKPIIVRSKPAHSQPKVSGCVRINVDSFGWGTFSIDRNEHISIMSSGWKRMSDNQDIRFAVKAVPSFFLNFISDREPYYNNMQFCKAVVKAVEWKGTECVCQLKQLDMGVRYLSDIYPEEKVVSGDCAFAPIFNDDDTVAITMLYDGEKALFDEEKAWKGKVEDNLLLECQCPEDTWFRINKFNKYQLSKEDVGKTIWFTLRGQLYLFASEIELVGNKKKFGGTRGK